MKQIEGTPRPQELLQDSQIKTVRYFLLFKKTRRNMWGFLIFA
jgi:hypothetical protein